MTSKYEHYFRHGGETFVVLNIDSIRGGHHSIHTPIGTFYISNENGKLYDDYPFVDSHEIDNEDFKGYLTQEVKIFIEKKKHFIEFYNIVLNELEHERIS